MPAYVAGMDWVSAYQAAKLRLLALSGADHALIHVHAGLAIYLLVQIVAQAARLRRPALCGLVSVMAATVFNEALDACATGDWLAEQRLGTAMLTLAWPLALFLGGHFSRWHRAEARLRAMLRPSTGQAVLVQRPYGPTAEVHPQHAHPHHIHPSGNPASRDHTSGGRPPSSARVAAMPMPRAIAQAAMSRSAMPQSVMPRGPGKTTGKAANASPPINIPIDTHAATTIAKRAPFPALRLVLPAPDPASFAAPASVDTLATVSATVSSIASIHASLAGTRNPAASETRPAAPRLRVFPGYAAHWAHRNLPERHR